MSVNKVILLGNLGGDPEIRAFDNGGKVAKFSLATNETFKDKEGKTKEQVEWHHIELWNSLATIAEKYLKKGDKIYLEGKLKTDEWKDDAGNSRRAVKIRGINLTMLGGSLTDKDNKTKLNSENSTDSISSKPNLPF